MRTIQVFGRNPSPYAVQSFGADPLPYLSWVLHPLDAIDTAAEYWTDAGSHAVDATGKAIVGTGQTISNAVGNVSQGVGQGISNLTGGVASTMDNLSAVPKTAVNNLTAGVGKGLSWAIPILLIGGAVYLFWKSEEYQKMIKH